MQNILRYLLAASVLVVASSQVHAQGAFPTKPITILVGFAAGGSTDITTRQLAEIASKRLGQRILVVNRTGASGSVALTDLKNASADGHTLAVMTTGVLINAQSQKLAFDPLKDFTPIIQPGNWVYGLVVRSDSQFQKLADLIQYAKANPGKVSYSTSGPASPQHLVMAQLGKSNGAEFVHVPMNGGVPAVMQLLGGHVTAVSQSTEWKPFVTDGRLRLLALYSATPHPEYPGIPTLVQLGHNIVVPSVFSIVAPAAIPKDRLQKLYDAFSAAVQEQEYKDVLKRYDMKEEFIGLEDLRRYIVKINEEITATLPKAAD